LAIAAALTASFTSPMVAKNLASECFFCNHPYVADTFYLAVLNEPELVVASVPCNFVDIKQVIEDETAPSSFYVLDNGVTTLVSAGETYRWRSGELFPASSVVGEVWLASPVTAPLLFSVTQQLVGGSVFELITDFAISASGGGTTLGASSIALGGLILCAGSNITLSQNSGTSANSITVLGPSPSAASIYVSADSAVGGSVIGGTSAQIATLKLVAGSNISLSQNSQSITIVGAAGGGGAGVSALGAGTSTSVGSISISGGNNITISSSGASVIGISAPANLVNAVGAGTSTSAGSISFSAGPGITISSSGANVIGISGNTTVAPGTQTISASGTSVTAAGISLALAAGANISLQTATAVGAMTVSVSGENAVSPSGLASSTGTMVLAAGAGLGLTTGASSVSLSLSSVFLSAAEISASGGGATSGASGLIASGALILCAGSNITLSQTTGAGLNSVTIIGGAGGAGAAGTQTLSAAGTNVTGTGVSLALAAGANITLQTATGVGSLTVSIVGPSPQTVISAVQISGNTSGTSSAVSTGTLYLQAISPIGLSQSTTIGANSTTSNVLSVFGPAYSAASPLAVSTTGGTISYAGPLYSAGGILSVSTTGGTISYAATTPAVLSAAEMSGNTSGTSSVIATGTLILQAVSPMVLSQSTTVGANSTTSNILSILAPAFSAGAGLLVSTTGGSISYATSGSVVSSIGPSGSLSSGPITVSGVNLTVSSNGAGVLQLSAAAQTIQPSISAIEMSGNTSGTSSVITNGTVFVQAVSPIGLSQSTTTGTASTTSSVLSIFGPAYSAGGGLGLSTTGGTISYSQTLQGNIVSSIGPSGSLSSGPITVSGVNLTVSSNGAGVLQLSVAPDAAQTIQPGISAIQISGNTSGTSSVITNGTVFFQAISPFVLSQSTTIGTASTTSSVLSILGPTYSAGGGLGLSTTGGVISYSQTAVPLGTQTISASGTSITGTAISLALAAGANISLQTATAVGAMTVSISGSSVVSSLNGSTGAMSISAGANIGIGQAASTITISASSYSTLVSISTTVGGASSGTANTASSSAFALVAGSNITLSQLSTNPSITIIGPAPGAGAAGTNTFSASGTSIAGTALSLAFAAGANVSLQTATAVNSMTISVSASSYSTLVSVTTTSGGATSGTANTASSSAFALVAGSNITLSQLSTNPAVTVIGPAPTVPTSLILQDSNSVLWSVTIDDNGVLHTATVTYGNLSTLTLDDAGLTTSWIVGVSIAGALTTTSTTFSGANPTGFIIKSPSYLWTIGVTSAGALTTRRLNDSLASKISIFQNHSFGMVNNVQVSGVVTSGATSTANSFGSSLLLQRVFLPAAMTLTEVDLAHNISFAVTNSGAGQMSQSLVLYSFVNSTQLTSVLSISSSWSWSSGTSTTAGATSLTQFQGGWSGPLVHPMTFGSTSTTAGEYVVGHLLNFSASSTNWSVSLYGADGLCTSTTQVAAASGVTSATLGAMSSGGLLAASALTASTSTAITAFTVAPSVASVNTSGGLVAGSAVTGISSYGAAFLALSTSGNASAFTISASSGSLSSFNSAASISATGTAKSETIALVGASANSNIVSTLGTVAGSHITGTTTVSVLSNAGTLGINVLSSGGLLAGSFFTASGSLSAVTNVGLAALGSTTLTGINPADTVFSVQNTGSVFSTAFPSQFLAGIMSTGGIPAAITLTSTNITISGSQVFNQPWFCLAGS